MGSTDIIRMPPRRFAADGRLRRIGVELEFSGLDLDHIARIVRDVLGGEIEHLSDYEAEVRETGLMSWNSISPRGAGWAMPPPNKITSV